MSRPAFSVAGAVATSPGSVRVTFTRYPLTADRLGTYDALNPTNYQLRGAGSPRIDRVDVVPDHPDEVVVTADQPLAEGTWTVVVGDVRTAGGRTLVGNTATFVVGKRFDTSRRDEVFQSLVRDFNPAFRHGRNWRALLTAVMTGDRANRDLARAAFDQMFTTTASGRYLDDRGARSYLERLREVGMSDDDYRRLIVALDTRRVVPDVLREVFEIFYGEAAVRPVVTTEVVEPFSLAVDRDVVFETPTGQLRAVVGAQDFAHPEEASADEVAAWLNRWFTDLSSPLRATTTKVQDSSSWAVRVVGPRNTWISVTGGTAQSTLRFPTEVRAYGAGAFPTWVLTTVSSTGRLRFTTTSTSYDLSLVRRGDYVVVTGTEFAAANRGTHRVVAVRRTVSGGTTTQYWECEATGTAQTVGQLTAGSVRFFRPTRVHPLGQAVLDRSDEGMTVSAVTTVVRRKASNAQYLGQNTAITPTSILRTADGRISVEETTHGLAVGDWVEIESVRSSTTTPSVVAGDVVGPPLLTSASPVTHWATLKAPGRALVDHSVTAVEDLAVVVGGHDGTNYRDECSLFEIVSEAEVAPDARQFTYTWDSGADVPAARSRHRALAPQHPQLRGAVFVVGGYDGTALDTCYRYDPEDDAWTVLDSLSTPRYWHELVELTDGKVLAVGGFTTGGTPTNTVELYDPATDTWSTVSSMNFARARFAAALDSSGKVVVSGGLNTASVPTPTSESYDPNTDTWTRIGNSSVARYDCRAAVYDSRIYVAGGTGYLPRDGSGAASRREVEVLEASGSWTTANALPRARGALGLAAVGGIWTWGGGVVDADRGDGSRWSRSRGTMVAADRSSWCVLQSGVVLDVGGLVSAAPQDRAVLLVPASESWTGRGANHPYRVVEVVDDDNFVLDGTDSYVSFTPGTYRLLAAGAAAAGSKYVPSGTGPSPTSTHSTLATAVAADSTVSELTLTSASSFPDTGWVVLDLGTVRQVVVEYSSKVGNRLNLAAPIRPTVKLDSGAEVRLLVGKGGADVSAVATVLTASEAGLRMLLSVLDDVEAAGCELSRTVSYPGDRGLVGEGRNGAEGVWG